MCNITSTALTTLMLGLLRQLQLVLYQISAVAPAENQQFLQIWPTSGQNVAGFQFLAGFAKWHTQILQRSISQLVLKNCAVNAVIFSTLLRSRHHLATDKISCYEYPQSLNSFINKSQISPRPRPWPD